MVGVVFDIQNYCLYDGPGVRTCVYFKGCPLHCAWCHNPESIRPRPEMAYWRDRCALCGACVETCPRKALSVGPTGVTRDSASCDACGTCAEACPNQAMERIGFEITPEDLVPRLLSDKPFFDDSGGGVTLTGGEPTFQPAFLVDVLRTLKTRGIHCAIQTCGYFGEGLTDRLLETVDLFLFDLKHPDPARHGEGTGVGNEPILANFTRILETAGPDRIVPRIPLVPGVNTDRETITAFSALLRRHGYAGEVHLMPYHAMSRGKYERLGHNAAFFRGPELAGEGRAKIIETFTRDGFAVVWGG
jgi:pyruvate formate lyase activating enzyme